MHLVIVIFTLFAAWRWGDWRNWQRYHPTMIYIAMGNLLYNFVYANHYLWQLKPDFLLNHMVGEIVYTFITIPLTGLIFLSGYPKNITGQILHNLKFIAIYILIEAVLQYYGRIVYNYGWNIWWSSAWDFMMFPMWVLHHKKPLIAYAASIAVVVLVLALFPVNNI
jgi:hypothetical protein